MHTSDLHKKKRFWAGILFAQFVLFYILSKIALAVECFNSLFELKKETHQYLSSLFPFSIGDILYIVLFVILIYNLVSIFKKKKQSLLKLLVGVNICYFIYQSFWGMTYFQPPIINLLPKEEPSINEAKTLAIKYLNLCKESRAQVSEDSNGVFKIKNLSIVTSEILNQQKQLPLGLNSKITTDISNFKPSIFSFIMNDTGILGYYNPFSAEAQYNPNLPDTYLPFTLAHESAHQLGYAREQEANFIGYLIGIDSDNIDLKYSTQYFTLKSLLNSLVDTEPQFVEKILSEYSDGMKRDRAYEKDFINKHTGLISDFFGLTNHLFLKSNQQEGRITYSYFIELLIKYERLSITN
ncbi:DUF3810 domain-containing protein [Riemerella anatipestifer]|uniref:DUF3810 domain-containing protein n=1 Tax=Riemerella anatipestifer (strain ATCC 11845 / DSM 15868 / JCM 9532 / NCTC 11014) TaxID=693978 RepID=E4TCV9_RIEAD|nr:DUF3810 domain-containing protein [Riemerella anatipestifer]ADQ82618.1 hypothetical protein Riean_1461 [Riemerella anatipestifer ATCC 11845 = DSM 15868]ADZ11890.1 hypothetical protein RIA_0747 [Riemerella anatipestifer RA-GD]AFD56628.1 hypothetical protein RA0C_1741 [Riemerella anatipestifer ATCC 11845 = DSM 15868]AGC39396.1 hypothetical protein G148_0091 [Riemerella anatipestifer RA-CH-2]AKQ39651.1 hypothetical protein AS87_04815 [Riemerella anatipestifer Yb2]